MRARKAAAMLGAGAMAPQWPALAPWLRLASVPL